MPKSILNETLDEIARWLERCLEEPISLDRLARHSGYSAFYLHHKFTQRMGETPMGYLRRLRMERAAWWLIFSDRTIPQISVACGFASRQGFSRAFSHHFGRAPEVYRDIMVKIIEKRARSRAVQKAAGDVRILTLSPKSLTCLRHTGPYRKLPIVGRSLASWVNASPAPNRPDRFYLLNYDDRLVTKPTHIRYDLGCESTAPHRAPFHRVELPEGPTAILDFQGTLDEWMNAWYWFVYCWLRESRWHVRGNFFWDEVEIPSEFVLHTTLPGVSLLRGLFSSRLHIPLQKCGDIDGIPIAGGNSKK